MPLSTPSPLTSWVLGPRYWSLCDLSSLTTAVSLDAGTLPSQTDPLLLLFSPFLADLFACCLAVRTYGRHYKMGTCGPDALCSTYTLCLAFKIEMLVGPVPIWPVSVPPSCIALASGTCHLPALTPWSWAGGLWMFGSHSFQSICLPGATLGCQIACLACVSSVSIVDLVLHVRSWPGAL